MISPLLANIYIHYALDTMHRLIILILLVLFLDNTACADGIAQSRLTDQLPRNARWGVVAVELKAGKELFRTGNASAEPLVPASLVKLLTTGLYCEV